MKAYKDYRESLMKRLKDPKEAAAYINAASETGEQEDLLVAIRNVVASHGNVQQIAQRAHIPRTHLYSMFGKKGNPEIGTVNRLLPVLGLRFAVAPV
ncbi:MAG: transcriptional regulator [Elusimicrobia bacterium]|nr:transcriptional regulator [Elusimicrobiota bacterium]